MNHHSHAYGSIVGLIASVPANVITNADCPDPAAADEAAKMTGVRERRWVREGQTSADLCEAAAVKLLADLGWKAADLDLIVYVTQTPSRAVPADVYSIAAKLGASCPCMQINWSCSGYVYGLWTAMRMAEYKQRVLLLVGDATSTICDPFDRATAPLFGDAGSATAIEGGDDRAGTPWQDFFMGTDGAGADKLHTHCSVVGQHQRDYRCETLNMDGASVFSFTLKRVPRMVVDVLSCGEPDLLLFHQANHFMLEHLVNKCVPAHLRSRVAINIGRFGNTSCASIPLLMAQAHGAALKRESHRLAMFGFGAGWAWAGASVQCEAMKVAELIEV